MASIRKYLFLLWIICFIGTIDSGYLAYSHYRVHTDIGFRSFCAISKALNCDTVSQSPYAIFLSIPVPVWGVLGYLFFFSILFVASRKVNQSRIIFFILFLISTLFTVYSLILAFLSTYVIHSYCLLCILSYGVNIGLLTVTWVILKRLKKNVRSEDETNGFEYFLNRRKIFLPIIILFGVSVSLLWLFMPRYWMIEKLSFLKNSDTIKTGVTDDGHPFIGSADPVLIITEFSDYRCFQCRKMHYYIRELISKYPTKIRLIHRHFPLDHEFNPIVKRPFHVGSGILSLIGIYATLENKFWEVNDYIYTLPKEIKEINVRDIARDSGLNVEKLLLFLKDAKAREFLLKDINEGIKNRIDATPGFLIDGKVYIGKIPSEVIKEKLGL